LLSLLPGTFVTSPGFITGIVVFEFLYGLLLFAIMSTTRREAPEVVPEPEFYAVAPRPKAPSPEPAKAAPIVPAKTESKPPAKTEPKPAPKTEPKPPAKTQPAAKEPPVTVAVASPTPAVAPKVPAAPVTKPSQPPPTVAVNETPRGAPILGPLGPLIDPLQDCRVVREAEGVTIVVPAALHIFGPDGKVNNSPRAMTEVAGDFVAQVKVIGNIKPGTKPLKDVPFTFQGAGLLLWQNEDNYVRFERAAGYDDRGPVHQLLVEGRKDGKPTRGQYLSVRQGDLALRMERHGGDINCTYTSDGKTWLVVKKWSVNLPAKVNVGISASNVSPRPFPARFEHFVLNGKSAAKSG
jgi:regulation of enolase protein 1 (concanavalin A-like superfamily)